MNEDYHNLHNQRCVGPAKLTIAIVYVCTRILSKIHHSRESVENPMVNGTKIQNIMNDVLSNTKQLLTHFSSPTTLAGSLPCLHGDKGPRRSVTSSGMNRLCSSIVLPLTMEQSLHFSLSLPSSPSPYSEFSSISIVSSMFQLQSTRSCRLSSISMFTSSICLIDPGNCGSALFDFRVLSF